MKPAVQDTEGGVVVARDHDQLMVRADAGVQPCEQPVLGNSWCSDVARQSIERLPHTLPRLDVPPPVLRGRLPGGSAGASDGRRSFTKRNGSSYSAASPADIVHPKSTIHFPAGRRVRSIPVHPRLQDIGVRMSVRVCWQAEPLARLITRNIEGTTLRVAHERHFGVLWKTLYSRQVEAGAAAPWRQVCVDLIDGLAIEPSPRNGLVVGVRDANQRHTHGRAVDHPRLVTPCIEDAPRLGRSLQ